MNEHNYHVRLTEAEYTSNILFKLKMDELERAVFDAYAILEQAQTNLFFRDDILSDRMTLREFKDLMIDNLKEML